MSSPTTRIEVWNSRHDNEGPWKILECDFNGNILSVIGAFRFRAEALVVAEKEATARGTWSQEVRTDAHFNA